jgi:response regulator RpfG family c-di-GMP phosphodiesterase
MNAAPLAGDAALAPGESPCPGSAAPGPWTVLCVDDEPNILAALKRALRAAGYVVITAGDAPQGLAQLAEKPVDIVISDMQMPGIDGAAFLEQVHRRWPDVARVLLTGHSDMNATVQAINRGRIFRYLHKPWDEQTLLGALAETTERLALAREKSRLEALTRQQNAQLRDLNRQLEQRVAARTAELKDAHEKVERNYLKSIRVFSNLLELRGGGQTAGHCRRVADMARQLARSLGLAPAQVNEIFVAALLHDIGLMAVPDRMVGAPVTRLFAQDLTAYRMHVLNAEQSLMALDDMQPLLPLIRSHHERHDGQGYPDRLVGQAIPFGARILAVADAFDDLQHGALVEARLSVDEARALMRQGRGTQFDPVVLDAFLQITAPDETSSATDIQVRSALLQPGMVLSRDLVAPSGLLMLSAGHRLTASLIQRIREFEQRAGALEIHIHPGDCP